MDLYQGNNQPFFSRYSHEIKEIFIILGMLGFLASYKWVGSVRTIVDKPLDLAVAGISLAYSGISTFVYQKTGFDMGYVSQPPNPEFLFQVRVAAYINESRPGPLLDIGVDARLPNDQRERALKALLKFDSSSQWIQPFLNELAKGGLLGLYDKKTPVLDELMQRIRAEGGIRQTMVRAYADSVLSFMLQHPKPILRQHALQWVNDLMSEDAVFLTADRVAKEKDPETQKVLEMALWNVRAISDRETARAQILHLYASPPWPGVKGPLAYLLSRLGYPRAKEHLRFVLTNQDLSSDQRTLINLAMAEKPFPRSLQMSDWLQAEIADRKKARQDQLRWAMARHLTIQREQESQEENALTKIQEEQESARRKEASLAATKVMEQKKQEQQAVLTVNKEAEEKARKEAEQLAAAKKAAQEEKRRVQAAQLVAAKKAEEEARLKQARMAEEKKKEEKARLVSLKKAEEEARLAASRLAEARQAKAKKEELAKLEKERKAKDAAAQLEKEKKAKEEAARLEKEKKAKEELAKLEKERKAQEVAIAKAPMEQPASSGTSTPVKEEDINFNPDAVAKPNKESLKYETAKAPAEFPDVNMEGQVKTPKELTPTAKKPVDIVTVQTTGSKPTTPSNSKMKGFDAMEGKITDNTPKPVQVAKLPTDEEINQELAKRAAAVKKTAKPGQMRSVNLLFDVKNQDVPLYVNPGYTKLTGVILPIGSKGQATFKVMIGDDEWYQVKSKKDTGWANGSLLTTFEMPTIGEPIHVAGPPSSVPSPVKTSPAATTESTFFEPVYQGVNVYQDASDRAPQVGTLEEGVAYQATQSLKIGSERWFLMQLRPGKTGWVHGVDLQLASDILPPPEEPSESNLAPGEKRVSAKEDGVPVYSKPSIIGKKIQTISKGDSYKVVEVDEGSGNEWYKISIEGRKGGWVQSMFVTVIKSGAPVAKKSSAKK